MSEIFTGFATDFLDLILLVSGLLWFIAAIYTHFAEDKKPCFVALTKILIFQALIDWLKMSGLSSGDARFYPGLIAVFSALTLFYLNEILWHNHDQERSGPVAFWFNRVLTGTLLIMAVLQSQGFSSLPTGLIIMFLQTVVLLLIFFYGKIGSRVKLLFLFFLILTCPVASVSPELLLQVVLRFFAALTLVWLCAKESSLAIFSFGKEKNHGLVATICLLLLGFMVLGAIGLGNLARKEVKENILLKAEGLAAGMNPREIRDLPFVPKSLVDQSFLRIRKQMRAFGKLFPDLRGIYTLKQVDGRFYFGPENYAEDDPQASPIGTLYQKPHPRIAEVFTKGKSIAFGPYHDEYGEFVSAMAPVLCPLDRSTLCVVGVDVGASVFKRMVYASRLWFNWLSLLIIINLIIVNSLLNFRKTLASPPLSWALNHIESLGIAISGIFFAFIVFTGVNNFENNFVQTELARVSSLVFQRMRDSAFRMSLHLDDLLLLNNSRQNVFRMSRVFENTCNREFPFAGIIFDEDGQNDKLSGQVPVILQEFRLQKKTDELIVCSQKADSPDQDIIVLKKNPDLTSSIVSAGFKIDARAFLSSYSYKRDTSDETMRLQLFLLNGNAELLASLPESYERSIPKNVLISRSRSLYYPIFWFGKVLLLRFTIVDRQFLLWRVWVPAGILAFASLLVFFIVSLMIYMTRNQNLNLEVQVKNRTRDLMRSERRFRDLVESLSDLVWEVDPEGTYTYCYCGAVKEEMLGLSKMIGEKFYEIPTMLDKEQNKDFSLSMLKNPRAFYDFENRYLRPNGDIIYYSNSGVPFYDDEGNLAGFRGISRDVTEKKAAEEKLRESRERYMLAVKGTQDGIWDWDIKTNQVFLSARWKEMLGFGEKEIIDQFDSFTNLIHPEDRNVVLKYIDLYLQSKIDEFAIEFRMRHKNGDYIWILSRGVALRDENGKPYRMAGSHTDISPRRDAEKEIERTLVELEQVIDELHAANDRAVELRKAAEKANTTKSEFLANMSHEIRTPMNGVIGMIDLLLQTRLDEKQKRYAEVVKNSGEKLLAIINDILDFSKIEANKLELEELEFSPHQVVSHVAEIFAINAKDKNLELSVEYSPDLPENLIGDPNRLHQILLNLIGNAVKFTDAGSVRVFVSMTEKSEKIARIKFCIIDTGMGIPESARASLFSAFTQVDGSITRKFGGTGLGLAISRQLTELMNGELDFSSEEGKGSEFCACIPFRLVKNPTSSKVNVSNEMQKVAQVSPKTPEEAFASENENLKALLVEDNETNQIVASTMIEKLGFQVEIADNGVDAVNMMLEKRYDVVFMDCQMPELDGFAATRMIRGSGLEENQKVPIIAMTASALTGDREKCLAAGMSDYIAKPFRIQELEAVIRRWLKPVVAAAIEPEPRPDVADLQQDSEIFNYSDVLQRMMNSPQLAKTLIGSFINEAPEVMLKLEQALSAGNAKDAATYAHSLKGSAANIGAEKFSRQALGLEQKIKAGTLIDTAFELADLKNTFAELLQKINSRQIL